LRKSHSAQHAVELHPHDERTSTIETRPNSSSSMDHIVRLEHDRPTSRKGAINTRDLVRNALRMRPNASLSANARRRSPRHASGHEHRHSGSMTTLHANTPRDAQARLETMIMMAAWNCPSRPCGSRSLPRSI